MTVVIFTYTILNENKKNYLKYLKLCIKLSLYDACVYVCACTHV